ncbi:hypothetical protein CTI12_AA496340 [Artemisia annua]|uniref:Uncharacterized protein n=1 Tax=Artemisia annua TaxID=35608 RepID=A0A2U1LFN1_ARTAN|nr:hypothetical protein CTI12_AA496340 [Artemisia annua]
MEDRVGLVKELETIVGVAPPPSSPSRSPSSSPLRRRDIRRHAFIAVVTPSPSQDHRQDHHCITIITVKITAIVSVSETYIRREWRIIELEIDQKVLDDMRVKIVDELNKLDDQNEVDNEKLVVDDCWCEVVLVNRTMRGRMMLRELMRTHIWFVPERDGATLEVRWVAIIPIGCDSSLYAENGVLEGAQIAKYYLLMLQGKEFVAILAGSCGQNRGNQRPSICKVSRILRDPSKSPFDPQLVSIGPIHREDPKLKEFQWLKECYLNDLLHRCHDSTPKKTLEACLLKVNTLIPQIRESYGDMIKNCSDVELARMMVMDGCFILEFCINHEDEDSVIPNKMQNVRIAMDLMLLENQVPFVVLRDLFDCLAPYIFREKGSVTLSQVLDTYLAPYIKLFRGKNSTTDVDSHLPEKILTIDVDSDLPEKISTTDVVSDSTPAHVHLSKEKIKNPAHVLGYLHKRYHLVADEEQAAKSSNPIHADAEASKPVDEEQAAKSSNPIHADAKASKPVDEERIEDTAFHSIVELDRSGVNFKPHQEDVLSMTIKFQLSLFACLPWFWKPTLLMPTLVIEDFTELILRNFIAYEQSFPQDRYYFTSYAHAMDKLIDSQEDIAKLVESKVLVNNLGSNQEAADMINKICKNMFVTDFYYTNEFKRMDTYYNGYWPNTIAWLRRVYFSNPWSAIALVAAIILFGLTVVQTIFTIMAA